MEPTFERELEALLNRYSQETPSNTPDFILAAYLRACLVTWNEAVRQREEWYGRSLNPEMGAYARGVRGVGVPGEPAP